MIGMSVISYLILKGKIAESGADLSIVVLIFSAVSIGGQVLLKTEERKITDQIVTGALVIIAMAVGGFMMDGGFCGTIRNLIVVGIACGLSALRSMKELRKTRRRKSGYR